MLDFYQWLLEYENVGHSEDWGDQKKSNNRFNGDEYKARGIRSKYIAMMKSETPTKRRKKSRK